MHYFRHFHRAVKTYVAEHHGWRRAMCDLSLFALDMVRQYGISGLLKAVKEYISFTNEPGSSVPVQTSPSVNGYINLPPVVAHTASVDIIICVHNALTDVIQCLDAVVKFSSSPYMLIIVDDGSESETRDYLATYAAAHGGTLLRNDFARGYTCAANQGLRASKGDYALLLNSDAIVTEGWLDRLISCAESDAAIGLVGPLSNTASWQSIPLVEEGADWAANLLPAGISLAEMGQFVADFSGRTYPRMAFLNGFCLLIKRAVIDSVGFFDEESFGRGYGEENDYCLRARKAGWALAVADDTYVWHAQSKSYSRERRQQLSAAAGEVLAAKHGRWNVAAGVNSCREDRVLNGVRARAAHLAEKTSFLAEGRRRWCGRRVAFVLPLPDAGGGGNVIISEAMAMVKMGVEVTLFNLARCREGFSRELPGLALPVVYVSSPQEIAGLCSNFDAVVATVNFSVDWISPLAVENTKVVTGYYIQDYEPWFYPEDSRQQKSAIASYSLIPELVRLTKTSWNATTVKTYTGVDCTLVGPSYADDLFLPRLRSDPSWPDRPLRVAAMIRPASPRRNARLTMEVLQEVAVKHGEQLEIVLFGVESDAEEFLALPSEFCFRNVGRRQPAELAELFNNVDIFVDFSTHQAMGLTAMEAMACGVAVIVPVCGGADSFAIHETNALMVDTSSRSACIMALDRLVVDHRLRGALQREAIACMPQFFPEGPAFRILDALFKGGSEL